VLGGELCFQELILQRDWIGSKLEKARKAQEDLPWTKMEESAVDENWENVKSVEEMHGSMVTGMAGV
jgi:hypothetical protein